jgi:LacI family transcriptional regulator
LDRDDPPTAIFCSSDFAAITAVNVAVRLGISVPDELEVIGVGNTAEGAQMHPSLSSVGPADLFTKVAELIIDVAQSDGRRRPTRWDFPWQLYLRETSRSEELVRTV